MHLFENSAQNWRQSSGMEFRLDYVTLSGSGEPTLHSGIGEVIHMIKGLTAIPVAVLTNGSLLYRRGVFREQLLQADLIIPSLDAGSEPLFRLVNRPHPSLSFERMLEGLIRLREKFSGAYWLEVMLLGGISDWNPRLGNCGDGRQDPAPSHPAQFRSSSGRGALRLSGFPGEIRVFQVLLCGPGRGDRGEVMGENEASFGISQEAILAILRRRPCSLEDICAGMGVHRGEISKHLDRLMGRGRNSKQGPKWREVLSLHRRQFGRKIIRGPAKDMCGEKLTHYSLNSRKAAEIADTFGVEQTQLSPIPIAMIRRLCRPHQALDIDSFW